MTDIANGIVRSKIALGVLGATLGMGGCTGLRGSDGETYAEASDADAVATTDEASDTEDASGLYAECLALPEAALAGWEIGPDIMPTAESTAERIEAMGRHTWELALQLLDVSPAKGSVAMSPTSMSIALGMTYGQYQGQQCGAEILAKLQFPESDDALHETLGAAMLELESRAMPETSDESAVVLGLRSSIWGFPELPPAATLQWYGGRTHAISGDLQAAREVINCVIESDSRGLLPDFLPQGQPAADTTSYEINAAVLQAPWLHPLHAGGELSFERDDGMAIDLPKLSHALLPASHHEADSFSVIDLPLRGQALSIMFVVPKPDVPDLATLANNLTAQDLAEARTAAAPVYVDFAMPKVQISPTTLDYYKPLGLACEPYTLRKVLHSAAVELDEKGIKAAAATANESWEDGGGPSEADVSIVLDRPFLFFAYDRETDFVLYSGRYTGA